MNRFRFSFWTARRRRSLFLLARLPGPVEQIVKIPEHVGGLVHQVQIGLAVDATKGGVGEVENVQVPDRRFGHHFAQGQLHRLGGAHMTRPHGGGQDQNSRLHGLTIPKTGPEQGTPAARALGGCQHPMLPILGCKVQPIAVGGKHVAVV